MAPFPASSGAYGIWKLSEQRNAVMGSNWPGMGVAPTAID